MKHIFMHSKLKFMLVGLLLLFVAMIAPLSVFAGHGGSNSKELKVVSHLDDFVVGEGHISDVWALGNYAYVGSFYEPDCSLDHTGVHIIDISNPESPTKVEFIASPPNTRANDVKVEHIETSSFTGDILIFSNEECSLDFHPRNRASDNASQDIPSDQESTNGINIWDVTDPTDPKPLRQNFLRFPVHNTFIYQQGDKAYALVVDDINLRDFHIVDISKPSDPREVSVSGWQDWFDEQSDQLFLGGFAVPLLHDVWAIVDDDKVTAYLSYWDAGLVILDVSDPANPVFLGDSDYASPDPVSGLGPEGNSHVAVPTADGNFVFMGDEDFDPFLVVAKIASGPFDGTVFQATQGDNVPLIDENRSLIGPSYYVGLACSALDPAPSSDAIAIVQRGSCAFTTKAQNVQAAGYQGGIVFNSTDGDPPCEAGVSMIVEADIPFLFVARSVGFQILGIEGYNPDNCPTGSNPDLPAEGTQGSDLDIRAIFDGWGYGRILDVSDPGNIVELSQVTTENVMANPVPPGDHTMHNVIIRGRTAYISWYADGMRVIDFKNPKQPREVAHFVDDENGSDFWGVYLHDHPNGKTYILGSDRSTGLWLFEPPGR